MQTTRFDIDPFLKRFIQGFLLSQLGAMALVVLLIALRLHGIAVGLSFLIFFLLLSVVLWLYWKYQHLPLAREKAELKQKQDHLQSRILPLKQAIQACKQEGETLVRREQAEIETALRALQQAHIERGLASCSIKDATIPGIGPKLKNRLAASGILTALDASDFSVSQVPGFGEAKRLALMNWRTAIHQQVDATKPRELPADQLETIKNKYQQWKAENDHREKVASENLQKLETDLYEVQVRLKPLEPVTFLSYVAQFLSSRGYLAALFASVLVGGQILSGVSATASAIIASIPTATFTPTDTATPTITRTATVTSTQTITRTPTITNTPTVIFTPLPTKTRIPTIMPTRPLSTTDPLDGVTAICKDGTYSYSQHRSGTCSGHGGVREWINRPPK
jgi:hypothetical protein